MRFSGLPIIILSRLHSMSHGTIAAHRSTDHLSILHPSAAMDTIHEEAPPSRPTSRMTINIGFFPTVPGVYSYGGPSYAISSSEYSQAEYENLRIADLEHDGKLVNM